MEAASNNEMCRFFALYDKNKCDDLFKVGYVAPVNVIESSVPVATKSCPLSDTSEESPSDPMQF